MKFAKRIPFVLLFAAIALAAIIPIFTATTGAQNDGWWIMRAEYGTRAQHNDVTDILKDLISRGGVNGRVAVNNQTMGGDPAVGADKQLRIIARRDKHDSSSTFEEREFDYREGGFIDVSMYNGRRRDRDEWNDRPSPGYNAPDYGPGLFIIRGYYGVQGRTVNVTELLRSRVRDGAVAFPVRNEVLGGDPAPGADKVLIVVYRLQGVETATAVREGNMLSIP
jgi:hypothetical protein